MPDIKHQYDFKAAHRLIIDGKVGLWYSYDQIAKCGKFIAITDYYEEDVYEVKHVGVYTIEGICRVCNEQLPPVGSAPQADGS